MVTSGAIARGRRLLGLAERPTAVDELQAASAVGQGSLFRAYEDRLASHDVRAAQVLLTAFDMSERIHYLNARQTLQRLLAWHVVPVVNENDTTATDEITFGDNDFLSAQVAIMVEARQTRPAHRSDRPLQLRSPREPRRRADRGRARLRRARRLRDRRADLGLRLRRDAEQGGRGADGEQLRSRRDDLRRHREGDAAAGGPGGADRHRLPHSQRPRSELQAVASLVDPRAGKADRRRRCREGAARARLVAAAGRRCRGRGRLRGR